VRVFYKGTWDHADKGLIPKIFHDGFTFRGSLGSTLVGHEQFAGYVDWVMPIFTFEGSKARDLYVRGDVPSLIGQLKG
jgi:hypothetical protein